MLETILAIIGGALALLFGTGWAKEVWRRRQAEEELSVRRLQSIKQHDAAAKAALKIKDDLAKQQLPIDTKGRSDFK